MLNRRLRESYDASAGGGVETGRSGSERLLRLLISSYLETVTSHQQMQGVGVPANETWPYIACVASQI